MGWYWGTPNTTPIAPSAHNAQTLTIVCMELLEHAAQTFCPRARPEADQPHPKWRVSAAVPQEVEREGAAAKPHEWQPARREGGV